MNVSDFTAVISSKGLASSNKFEVKISLPGGTDIGNDLNLMCDSVTIAGKNIQSIADVQYGMRREVAYAAPTYDPLTLTFYCTEKLEEKLRLDEWQQKMVSTPEKDNTAGSSFNVGYYNTYALGSKIVVTKLDVGGTPVLSYEYREAYPKTITSLELSHEASTTPMKVTATFNYLYWVEKLPVLTG